MIVYDEIRLELRAENNRNETEQNKMLLLEIEIAIRNRRTVVVSDALMDGNMLSTH